MISTETEKLFDKVDDLNSRFGRHESDCKFRAGQIDEKMRNMERTLEKMDQDIETLRNRVVSIRLWLATAAGGLAVIEFVSLYISRFL